jgi:hypothetical protein
MDSPKYFRPAQAAALLRENLGFGAVRSLAKLRCIGGGPNFHRAGRLILYSEDDLLSWARSRLTGPHRSTSETSKGATSAKGKRGRPCKTIIEYSAPQLAE